MDILWFIMFGGALVLCTLYFVFSMETLGFYSSNGPYTLREQRALGNACVGAAVNTVILITLAAAYDWKPLLIGAISGVLHVVLGFFCFFRGNSHREQLISRGIYIDPES